VWYRDSARRRAEELKLGGYARNLSDGRVELVAEGDELAVAQFLAWARKGPPRALVTDVSVIDEPLRGDTYFAVR
jgi:acylphosphatase